MAEPNDLKQAFDEHAAKYGEFIAAAWREVWLSDKRLKEQSAPKSDAGASNG